MARLRYERSEQHGFIEFLTEAPLSNANVVIHAKEDVGSTATFEANIIHVNTKSIFLNSYFLSDGPCQIHLKIFKEDGNEAEELNVNCEICNGSSSLAAQLMEYFKEAGHLAIQAGPIDSTYFKSLPESVRVANYPAATRNVTTTYTRRVLDQEQIDNFDNEGFIVLDSFFDEHTIKPAIECLRSVNVNDLHGFTKGSSQRIVNLHETYPALEAIYSCTKLYDAVSDIFGVQAFPCQSLTFINGSTQDAHQDTVHLTPFPRGLMCGIWIAIEDVVPGAGELIFFPGSHTLPAILCSTHQVPKVDSEDGDYSKFSSIFTPLVNELLSSRPNLESKQFIAKAGDVLIWQENLIHGGAPRTIQDQTRMSMVIHAFGEPALIYYDSLGMSGKRDTTLD
jgi:hypothetical protein